MFRREFIKSSVLASLGIGVSACASKNKLDFDPSTNHYLSLSFDDEFKNPLTESQKYMTSMD